MLHILKALSNTAKIDLSFLAMFFSVSWYLFHLSGLLLLLCLVLNPGGKYKLRASTYLEVENGSLV